MLSVGTKLGPYEIVAPLGAGGMGEVYRARDAKLNRDVALKVIPDTFALDSDRVSRFTREAQVLASLNHPHIAAIYGFEDSGETHALVLELVEGETLADRVARGPIPLDEALPIARQICEAVEAAHEAGIIHRDLKPANIKITPEGVVKVLDFGLAKLTDPAHAPASDRSLSPTITTPAMTQAGMILGTAAYMSPEQAKGRPADKRSDIWAFGCVLFEMLTGTRPFDGDDVSDTIAGILRDEPDWSLLPSGTPSAVRKLLRRCLAKNRSDRLADAGDARLEINEALATPEITLLETSQARRRPARERLAWALATLFLAVTVFVSFVRFRGQIVPAAAAVRFQIPPPPGTTLDGTPVVSPNGRRIAFPAMGQDGRTQIWVRSLDSLDARELAGTEGVRNPVFWSADSRFIGFAALATLKRVDASGGSSQRIVDLPGPSGWKGGAWSAEDVIVFGITGSGLSRVAATGGAVTPVTTFESSRPDSGHSSPVFLPDGHHLVYLRPDENGVYVASVDMLPQQQGKERLATAQSGVAYVPSEDTAHGYLVFERDTTLVAQPFDAERLQLAGEAVPIAENVGAAFSVSATGVLALRNTGDFATTELVWFDRHGTAIGRAAERGAWSSVKLASDRRTLVTTRGAQIWIGDLQRGVFTRLNPGAMNESSPAVSPDGRVAFSLGSDIFVASANGAAAPELLVTSPIQKHPNDWSRDGRFLIYDEHHLKQRQDLWIVPMSGNRTPVPFLVTLADETFGQFSPDGRRIAYSSDESGRREVYVRDFAPERVPAAGIGKWQISTAGGDKPHWSSDGNELYYIAADRKLMAVPVKSGPLFEPGVPVPLFETNAVSFFPYDVSADGRFLINSASSANASPMTVLMNWRALLKP